MTNAATAAAEQFAREMKSRVRDYEPRHRPPKADDAGLAPRRPPRLDVPDYVGRQDQAERLAQMITSYWASKGRTVIALPERFREADGVTGFRIRTTLYNGQPR
jgi:hypothetical protein